MTELDRQRPALPSVPAGPYDRYFRPGYVHTDLYTSPAVFADEMRLLYGSVCGPMWAMRARCRRRAISSPAASACAR